MFLSSVTKDPNIPTIVSEPLDPASAAQRQEGAPGCGDMQVSSLGSDLEQVSITDLLPMNGDPTLSLTNISVDSNIHTEPMETESLKASTYHQQQHHHLTPTIKPEPVEKLDPHFFQPVLNDQEFSLTLRYRRQVIENKVVTNPHGCRVFYGDLRKHLNMWNPQLFGNSQADQIMVPYEPGKLEVRQDQLTLTLLEALELGINIYMDKDSIYLLRRCKTTVFTSPPNRIHKQTFKVERGSDPVKVFDYTNDFLPAFLKYQHGQGPRPSPQVIVAMGQNFHDDLDPYVNLLLSVTLVHPLACRLMSQYVPETSAVEISRSNEYDRFYSYVQAAHNTATTAAGGTTTSSNSSSSNSNSNSNAAVMQATHHAHASPQQQQQQQQQQPPHLPPPAYTASSSAQ